MSLKSRFKYTFTAATVVYALFFYSVSLHAVELQDDDMDGGDVEMFGGADVISGNRGDDMLFGGGSNDTLNGGSDRDSCSGDGGADIAVSCESQASIP